MIEIHAPQLARVADALWALAENPDDRAAKIKVALLEKQGALQCPTCGARFDVRGFRGTFTPYLRRRTLTCLGCTTQYVVEQEQIA
jgi:hypothetical protein